jgi:hypothetical protein
MEVELRARQRLATGAVTFNTFHHASISVDTLVTCPAEPPGGEPRT